MFRWGHHISGYRVNRRRTWVWWSGTVLLQAQLKIVFVVGIILFSVSLFMGRKTTLDFRPLRKFYPKPVQRTGFCGFSE